MLRRLGKTYSHREVENRWYEYWLAKNHFRPSGSGTCFSMVIPPPNVTGSLHMGHALNNTLQDILCRYKRMDGYAALWIPGTDHAGIATQNVVERRLGEQGISRAELGRSKFIENVWLWRKQTGNTILQQLKALGVSCDWGRERFTMDEGLSLAVREAFVRLWEDGLLYRAERLINWCPRCKTALADIEVVHEEIDAHLWHIRYLLMDDPSRYLIVATTRPETMLGDTAVAVHPEDERYKDIIGRSVSLPIADRKIPVISDLFVDREFGTGALKITPAHDFNDFEIGEKHGLAKLRIFDEEARVSPGDFLEQNGQEPVWLKRYKHKERYEARNVVVEELKEKGLLEKIEPYHHSLGRCYRCYTAIEPYLTPQWFVRIQPLAGPAAEAVQEGRIRIIPEGWRNSYFAWMENIKDWCVSRQIWWGHQIPAWYCRSCNASYMLKTATGDVFLSREAEPIVERRAPSCCPKCGGDAFVQDPDVLDTWFSSALWPFSTLGWPEQTEDLKTFYPTSVLVTGFDILFFWVARMIMMGLKVMGDVPFREVYIHALVRDQEGQKMSKSKGNVIDPLEIMNRYGTDAFRFTLASLAAMGRDVKLSEERISGYQNFVNKLWNAARFVLMNLTISDVEEKWSLEVIKDDPQKLADRWILSRLASTITQAREAIDSYRFNEFAHHLYQFTWHEFCDWYIEMSKLSLNSGDEDERRRTEIILAMVLENILLLLHPLMPFVTEEIWQALAKTGEGDKENKGLEERRKSIMIQDYPKAKAGWIQPNVEEKIGFLIEVVRAIRNLRTETSYPPSKEVRVILFGTGDDIAFLKDQEAYLCSLARAGSVEYLTAGERPKVAATAVVGTTQIYLPLHDTTHLRDEKKRLEKEVQKVEEELARVRKKLGNEQFLAKAKEEVIQKEKNKATEFEDKIKKLNHSLSRIRELESM